MGKFCYTISVKGGIIKLSDEDKKLAAEERSREQETWHRIVVKVISWTDGLKSGGIIKEADKVTLAEWKAYCNRYMKINVNRDKKRIDEDLAVTKQAIESYNGFEKS